MNHVAQLRGLSLMTLFNPPHPGEFISNVYLEPFAVSGRQLAQQLSVAASTLNRLLKCQSSVSPEMALRLSKVLGRSPESWLSMQYSHDLWKARKSQTGATQKTKI
jgi:antitoxin HigA-1